MNRYWVKENIYKHRGFNPRKTKKTWWENNDKITRNSAMKNKLEMLLGLSYDPTLTEFQNMDNSHYYRVWDSGNILYKWKKEV